MLYSTLRLEIPWVVYHMMNRGLALKGTFLLQRNLSYCIPLLTRDGALGGGRHQLGVFGHDATGIVWFGWGPFL